MVIGSNILAGSSGQGGGYNISRSLRFRASATAYLSRTPASSGTRTAWTWSDWIKRGSLGSFKTIFTTNDAVNNSTEFYFNTDDTIKFREYASSAGGYTAELYTTQVFRDPSAWYHVMLVWDSNNGTSSDRLRLYINGVRVTSFSTANYPTSGRQTFFNSAYLTTIGVNSSSSTFDGYRTEVNFIDGQALTPSSFGETSTNTGVWIPKRYTGTYGTNGFYLPFSDNTSTTTLGADSSGNGNNWTCNNISLTTGSTYDSMLDVPTLTSATASNFATLNPLTQTLTSEPTKTITNGNLTLNTTQTNGNIGTAFSTIAVTSGKYYCEYYVSTVGGASGIGFINYASLGLINCASWGIATPSDGYTRGGSGFANNSSNVVSGLTTITNGSTVMLAVDFDSGKIWTGIDGTWDSSGNPSAGTNPLLTFTPNGKTWVFGVNSWTSTTTATSSVNFGQRPFSYTVPTGFSTLNTYNLPTPTIGATASSQANKYFDVATWTGANTNGGNSVSSLAFSPDLVWTKIRSQAYSHLLYDRLRGTGATAELSSDQTVAEGGTSSSERGYLNSFDTNGFSSVVGSNGDNLYFNQTSQTYVAWNWKANGSGSSNTSGSITSTVSANTTSGFSIVTYTGTGANATVGHGLGVAPKMYIVKNRNSGGTYWGTYHTSIPASQGIYLNSTGGASTNTVLWNSTAPTSSVFSVGTSSDSNESGWTYVAYCFAEVAGFSKAFSYTGNGSTDSPFIYCGFKPRWIMFKRSSSSQNWLIFDSARDTYNQMGNILYPNLSSAEYVDSNKIDFLSNGIKIRSSQADLNTNGETYIGFAIAENPFKYSLAR